MRVDFNENNELVCIDDDEEFFYLYRDKDIMSYDEDIAFDFDKCIREIAMRGSGRKLITKYNSCDYSALLDGEYYFITCIDSMKEGDGYKRPNSDEIEVSLMILALIQAKRRIKERKELEGTIDSLHEEIDNLRRKLNGRQFQIDQVKSGKAKPSYRDDITPEKVQVLYDKLKNKSAVARELGVDRRLIDRRLKEMQMRNGGGKKQ